MKKFISGFVAGALLFGGTAAIAAQPSLIGQKVQGIFSVEKNGKKIADAVVVNGATYAPVRALAEAAGAELKVEGKKITMLDKEAVSAPQSNGDVPLTVQISGKKVQLDEAKSELSSWQRDKQGWQDMLSQLDASTEYGKAIAEKIAEADKKIVEAQAKVSRIEAELAALQTQQ